MKDKEKEEEEEEIEEQRSTKNGRKGEEERSLMLTILTQRGYARSESLIFTIVSIIHTINSCCFNHRHGVITSRHCLGKWKKKILTLGMYLD